MRKEITIAQLAHDLEGRRVTCSISLFALVNRTLNAHAKYAVVEDEGRKTGLVVFRVADSNAAKAAS